MCRTLKMFLSIDSSLRAKAYFCGSSRYGGNAWPFVRQDDSSDRIEVIWFEVEWWSATSRRKSFDQAVCSAADLSARERLCDAYDKSAW